MTYLYLLWAADDEFTKVGISKSPKKRFNTHAGNSSNPLMFEIWRLYKFLTIERAREVERHIKSQLASQNYRHRDKRELFRCKPLTAEKILLSYVQDKDIEVIYNYPIDDDHLLDITTDFVTINRNEINWLEKNVSRAYERGLSDAFFIFSFLGGCKFSGVELFRLYSAFKVYGNEGIDPWRSLLSQLEFMVGDDSERRNKIRDAYLAIENWQAEAYEGWQVNIERESLQKSHTR